MVKLNTHKHLGLHLTYTLDCSVHVHHVCLRANRKLAVLRSVKMLKRHTLDLLYKLTVRSCIDYALPVYYHSLKVTEKAKLSKIQYTAGKIVSGALHLTGKETLNTELSWESIETRADFLGLSIFHKIAKNDTRPLIRDCLPKRKFNPETLRSGDFNQFQFKGQRFALSFFPLFTKKYNLLKSETKKLTTEDFKNKLSADMKPIKQKHFSYGYTKHANILLTRIRVGNSFLKAHSYSRGHSDTNICPFCEQNKIENSKHFIISCPHFAVMRRTLLDRIEQDFIPKFKSLSINRQFQILIFGYEPNNPEMKRINGKIMLLTQTFILKTKRF